MAWNTQNVFKKRNLVISPKQQLAWGNALDDADLTRRLTFDPGAYVNVTKQFRSDRDKTGKGHDSPTYRVPTDQDMSFDIAFDVDDFLLGWIPAFLMGDVATVGVGPYTHTIKYQQVSGTALATTIYLEDSDGLKRRFEGVGLNTAEFSGQGRGVVQCRVGMIGSGRIIDGAMAALPPLPTIKELLASDVQVKIGPPGGAVAIDIDRVLSWTVTLSQDISPRKGPGSGLYATQLKIGHPTPRLQMTISAKETDDLLTLFLNNTEREIQVDIPTAADCALNIKFPSIYLSAAQVATDSNEVVLNVESDENSILKSGVNEPVIVTAINSQSTYLGVGT